jgi:hypothetical protein
VIDSPFCFNRTGKNAKKMKKPRFWNSLKRLFKTAAADFAPYRVTVSPVAPTAGTTVNQDISSGTTSTEIELESGTVHVDTYTDIPRIITVRQAEDWRVAWEETSPSLNYR